MPANSRYPNETLAAFTARLKKKGQSFGLSEKVLDAKLLEEQKVLEKAQKKKRAMKMYEGMKGPEAAVKKLLN
jgi:hypothetical protein